MRRHRHPAPIAGRRARGVLAALAASALAAGLAAPLTGSAGAAPADPASAAAASGAKVPVPELDYTACRGSLEGLRCARVEVPLDYDRPRGATTALALAKRPADQPEGKIGTLFVNPGGPGGAARDFVRAAAFLLGPIVRARFDIVGIDPRGVGGSTPARCTIAKLPPVPRFAFPYSQQQIRKVLVSNARLRGACDRNGNAILDHMSTADTARDMNLVRRAVGDAKLSYYGISYGSYLGASYAAMFPGKVRALIVDAVLDPVAWSTGRGDAARRLPFSYRLGSGLGANKAMHSALRECDRVGKRRCAFAHDSVARWEQLVARLKRGPADLGGGGEFSYADLIGFSLGPMYDGSGYRPLMRNLEMLYRIAFGNRRNGTDATGLREAFQDSVVERAIVGPYAAGSFEPGHRRVSFSPGFQGVACADSVNPKDPRAWVGAAVKDEKRGAGGFGRLWTWISSACAGWPGSSSDAFRGPWRVRTETPLLIVGNTYDPATPISGARALRRLLPGSRLVELQTWGHGAIGQSRCVTERFSAYLVKRSLPDRGATCRPDRVLYPGS